MAAPGWPRTEATRNHAAKSPTDRGARPRYLSKCPERAGTRPGSPRSLPGTGSTRPRPPTRIPFLLCRGGHRGTTRAAPPSRRLGLPAPDPLQLRRRCCRVPLARPRAPQKEGSRSHHACAARPARGGVTDAELEARPRSESERQRLRSRGPALARERKAAPLPPAAPLPQTPPPMRRLATNTSRALETPPRSAPWWYRRRTFLGGGAWC